MLAPKAMTPSPPRQPQMELFYAPYQGGRQLQQLMPMQQQMWQHSSVVKLEK
jgi:hypothetical protein